MFKNYSIKIVSKPDVISGSASLRMNRTLIAQLEKSLLSISDLEHVKLGLIAEQHRSMAEAHITSAIYELINMACVYSNSKSRPTQN